MIYLPSYSYFIPNVFHWCCYVTFSESFPNALMMRLLEFSPDDFTLGS